MPPCLLVCSRRRPVARKEEVQYELLPVERALPLRPPSRGERSQDHQLVTRCRKVTVPAEHCDARKPGRHTLVATTGGGVARGFAPACQLINVGTTREEQPHNVDVPRVHAAHSDGSLCESLMSAPRSKSSETMEEWPYKDAKLSGL